MKLESSKKGKLKIANQGRKKKHWETKANLKQNKTSIDRKQNIQFEQVNRFNTLLILILHLNYDILYFVIASTAVKY
jgi:hypothetical protein